MSSYFMEVVKLLAGRSGDHIAHELFITKLRVPIHCNAWGTTNSTH